ncbi:MAG: ribonuclease R [Desulforhopalus sp.]|nr:ribonuclease R [Desulforhopalus sp.]
MPKKRNPPEKSRKPQGNRAKERRPGKENRQDFSRNANLILGFLYTSGESVPLATIEDHLVKETGTAKDLAKTIDSLLHEGLITKNGKRQYALARNAPLYEGPLVQHPNGFGFVGPVQQHGKEAAFLRDPFVSAAAMGSAQHGDRVLIRVLRVRKDDRPEAVVLRILARGPDKIAGIYRETRGGASVFPDDSRFPFTIKIADDNGYTLQDGDAVIVQYTREARQTRVLTGKILNVLGSADTVDTQMQLVIQKFDLPHEFSTEALQEAESLAGIIELEEGREDLRQTPHVTIDGETAKDFDDAICVMKTRRGFRLYVSIADVSHYVPPGSAIDKEAYARGTSIYFPGRVLPMLPERLSNDLCSLVPGQDRLTVSAILDFDKSGTLQNKRFTRSVICSNQRFTYTTVKEILIDKDPAVRKQYKPFLTQLRWAQELATALQARRRQRGSIDFNLPEAEFTVNDTGEVTAIYRAERNFAHQLIEEFMLAANEAVAELATARKVPAIYRVHEPPDPLKMEAFFTFAKTLGLQLPPMEINPAWFAKVLAICNESRYEYIINNLLLRSMKQAQYSAENVGHFGLASSDYTHFTSPIRRYPDLIVHRTLLRLISRSQEKKQPIHPSASLKDAGDFLSTRERVAITAERDIQERLKINFMQKHIGDSFDAIISGVNDSALFIEIPSHCISGSIGVDRLTDDYYLLDSKNHRLFGEITAKTYRIGDPLRVTLEDVDFYRRRLNFILASDSARKKDSWEARIKPKPPAFP